MSDHFKSIKEWEKNERPREKLKSLGSAVLSINELLAVILRSGKRGESALDLSRRILNDYNYDLHLLAKAQVRDLIQAYTGIGDAKACSLIAAVELGRRRAMQSPSNPKFIKSSSDAYEYIAPLLKDLDHEEFWVIFLNRANKIIDKECLSSGGITGTVIDIRILFRKALSIKCCAIIAVHNHPGGSLFPGGHDKIVTEKIVNAGKILDITLHDHIIIGNDGYYSFADEGKL